MSRHGCCSVLLHADSNAIQTVAFQTVALQQSEAHVRRLVRAKQSADVRHRRKSMRSTRTPDETLSAAIERLRDEVGELIDLEKAVIRLELKYKLFDLRRSSMRWAAGAVLCAFGALCVTTSAVLVFARVMPAWVAALIVGTTLAFVGTILLRRKSRRSTAAHTEHPADAAEGVEVPVSSPIGRSESVH